MDSYELKEKIGRAAFDLHSKQFTGITNIEYTEWNFERYDGTYYSADTKTYFEIKTRNYLAQTKFKNKTGWILEKKKYDALKLIQKNETEKCRYVYVNIFLNAIVIWDITDLEITEWQIDSYQKNDAGGAIISKQVAYMKIEDYTHANRLRMNFESIAEIINYINKK